jgi:hypothetical protein
VLENIQVSRTRSKASFVCGNGSMVAVLVSVAILLFYFVRFLTRECTGVRTLAIAPPPLITMNPIAILVSAFIASPRHPDEYLRPVLLTSCMHCFVHNEGTIGEEQITWNDR